MVAGTFWWIVGWFAGGAVVLVAAALLLTIIALARRVVGQAGEIVTALDGARRNTEPLFSLGDVNYLLEAIAGRLRGDKEDTGGERGVAERVARTVRGWLRP